SASKNILINIVLIMFCFSTKAIDQEVISDAFHPKRANHEQYQELFNNAYNFLEFCEDTASNFQRSDYFEENINRVYDSNIESAQFIINALHHLDYGGLTVDSILQSCLLMRLQLIKSHANLFHQSQEYYQRFNQL